jgi:hypothetical protein
MLIARAATTAQALAHFGVNIAEVASLLDESVDQADTQIDHLAANEATKFKDLQGNMVARDGIEPPTRGFSIPCSTN